MKFPVKANKTLYDSCDIYAQKFVHQRITKKRVAKCAGDTVIQELCRNCTYHRNLNNK